MSLRRRIDSLIRDYSASGEALVIALLTILWGLFFWRALTPNVADQVSLPQGDFSGQFLAFGAYQARRLLAGELPLWNPYNYGGAPFLADTQAAVFYPIRLISILIGHFTGGWGYATLQAEVLVHFWLASILMYWFMRNAASSRLAGITSAITATYGGYLTGYPPLQVAVLEAGIWLPLGLLGIFRASQPDRAGWRFKWVALSGVALGISLLAGHPQTSLFFTYVLIAYAIHRGARGKLGWRSTILVVLLIVGLGYGLAAIQILPGLEYASLSTRSAIGFDARAGGFQFADLVTFLIPKVFTVWSPLYSGISSLILAIIAYRSKAVSARFWTVTILVAFAISLGWNTIVYQVAYLLGPGISLFRGQERAAYVIAYGMAIMAGLGAKSIENAPPDDRLLRRVIAIAGGLAWAGAFELLIIRFLLPQPSIDRFTQAMFFLAVLITLVLVILVRLGGTKRSQEALAALICVLVFDLFSNNIHTNWEAIPASQRALLSDLVPPVLADQSLFRVDGRLGLGENYGTMIGVQDIRGTSPLRLQSVDGYATLPDYRQYQLLNVKYVFTDWTELQIPSTVRAQAEVGGQKALLHEVTDPMPRAWMAYQMMETGDRGQALGWIADSSFDPSKIVILSTNINVNFPKSAPSSWSAAITEYAPEHIKVVVDTPVSGILILSEFYYPGWQAVVDGTSVDTLNVDAGLRGVLLGAGHHLVTFDYRPLSLRIGSTLSLAALVCLALVMTLA